jgi:hypothetical protein
MVSYRVVETTVWPPRVTKCAVVAAWRHLERPSCCLGLRPGGQRRYRSVPGSPPSLHRTVERGTQVSSGIDPHPSRKPLPHVPSRFARQI